MSGWLSRWVGGYELFHFDYNSELLNDADDD